MNIIVLIMGRIVLMEFKKMVLGPQDLQVVMSCQSWLSETGADPLQEQYVC